MLIQSSYAKQTQAITRKINSAGIAGTQGYVFMQKDNNDK